MLRDQWVHSSRVLHEMMDSAEAAAAITATTDSKYYIMMYDIHSKGMIISYLVKQIVWEIVGALNVRSPDVNRDCRKIEPFINPISYAIVRASSITII